MEYTVPGTRTSTIVLDGFKVVKMQNVGGRSRLLDLNLTNISVRMTCQATAQSARTVGTGYWFLTKEM